VGPGLHDTNELRFHVRVNGARRVVTGTELRKELGQDGAEVEIEKAAFDFITTKMGNSINELVISHTGANEEKLLRALALWVQVSGTGSDDPLFTRYVTPRGM
jgi:hypothetical protein